MKMILYILAGAYVLICFFAFLFQSRLVFFPDREDVGSPADVDLSFRDVTFLNAAGKRLHGWMVPAAEATYTLLYCHGNAGNLTHRVEAIRQYVAMGVSVFIFDYAGYGKSEGRPSEQGTYQDAEAAWRYLTDEEGIDPNHIIVFGRSLGAAVAIELAATVQPRAIVLESCFTSIPELGTRVYPWLPVHLLSRIRYNSLKKIPRVRAAKMFVHSIQDEVIPFGMGRRLYNHAPRPKTFVKVRGGHNDAYLTPGSNYATALSNFLDDLR